MKFNPVALVAGSILLCLGGSAFADEVTTTKTVKTTDPTVVVTPAPAPGIIVDGDGGCTTKQVTKTDGETGDTVKKTKTDC